MTEQTQAGMQRRLYIFEHLDQANTWLSGRASASDVMRHDLESARVRVYSQLVGSQRTDVPSVLTDFADRETVSSIDDMIELREGLISQMRELLADPESFGVTLLHSLDEETVFYAEEDA